MDRQLQQMMEGMSGGGGGGGVAPDMPTNDNAETVYISSLALLKVSLALLSLESDREDRVIVELNIDGNF